MGHKKKKQPPKNKGKQMLWLIAWSTVSFYFSAWTFIWLARGVPGLALLHFVGALFSFLIALQILRPDQP